MGKAPKRFFIYTFICGYSGKCAGDALGALVVRQGDQELARRDILAAEDVDKLGFIGMFKRLAAGLFAL